MNNQAQSGIYEALLTEAIQDLLQNHPELRTVFGKIDPEEQPSRYSAFVAMVLEQVLKEESDPEQRLALCNQIIGQLTQSPKTTHLKNQRLISQEKPLLLEITPPHYGATGVPRPHTPLSKSSLFTGSPQEPQLAHELMEEMRSADGVDILVSFIKWSGLRLLMPAFEDLRIRKVPVRLLTTSYMGASDAPAVEWLARMPNVQVRVSYDTQRTRLHAKAYHFQRNSGFCTAYIGSANMSQAAITSGLEWNLKITAQDMGNILEKFSIEFETYWNSREFLPFDPEYPEQFRAAIQRARNPQSNVPQVFFDLNPHPFQERILEALNRERITHGRWRNLVIAATGTGKTVVAAFDFLRFFSERKQQARLLFVAHRQEILQQARATFANVLRDQNFGQLLVGGHEAERLEHLFCSVNMLNNRRLWEQVGEDYYDFIVVDEAHHGTASSYRPLFQNFKPKILLGLTATPERMDGGNVAADFGNRFAAEIRLPEALDEKLLCPFQYFGVADPIAIDQDQFWRNGKYDVSALENVYVLDRARADLRVNAIINAIAHYEPDLEVLKGIGFCVSIQHAHFMAEQFNQLGIPSAAIVSGVDNDQCTKLIGELQRGSLKFLFTVDKMSEGIDLPDVNIALFLRPTESLTVFLQQLGRGLRHAPGKDCLTVLDFVGQVHRRYRLDSKLKALLPRHRFSIEKEVVQNFPHLPAGCSIQFDRLSRQYVLSNIRENLRRLTLQVPDRLQTFASEAKKELTFGNFVSFHDYEPEALLSTHSWTKWKALAQLAPVPQDPDLKQLRKTLVRVAFINGPREIDLLQEVINHLSHGRTGQILALPEEQLHLVYSRLWGKKCESLGFPDPESAFRQLTFNPTILADLKEILDWAKDTSEISGSVPDLPFSCPLELHARYGGREIQAAFGKANFETNGQTGVGIFHFPDVKAYALLITFQKTEQEFSPSTMYADYPISRELLHWESQSTAAQNHLSGQNLIHHQERKYTVLIFARDKKKVNGATLPFTYFGPVDLVSFESERPIKMVWRLRYPMPVEMFEDNRKGG